MSKYLATPLFILLLQSNVSSAKELPFKEATNNGACIKIVKTMLRDCLNQYEEYDPKSELDTTVYSYGRNECYREYMKNFSYCEQKFNKSR